MRIGTFLTAVVLALSLSACQLYDDMGTDGSEPAPHFSQFSDIPIPENATMDLDNSIIFGTKEEWLGRLVYKAPYAVNRIFDFYMTEMRKYGWQEVTVVRTTASSITFTRGGRVATLSMQPTGYNSTEIMMTMSPRGSLQQGAAPAAQQNPIRPMNVPAQQAQQPQRQTAPSKATVSPPPR